jgi:predicted TIM-barrel fold metal-dependent hydrolase
VRKYKVISGDGHLEVPAENWTKYVPMRFAEMTPKLIHRSEGDWWKLDEFEMVNSGNLVCDLPYDEIVPGVWRYFYPDGTPRPGTGTGEQRLREQDLDGLDAEVLFPPIYGPKFLRQLRGKDPEAYLANISAYNTWLAQEYCSVAPDRLIGNALIPETGIDDAITEMIRCKEMGLRAVCLFMWPNGGSTRAPEDEQYFAACLDHDMRLVAHETIGNGEQAPDPRTKALSGASKAGFVGCANSVTEFILSGVLDKFPTLKVYFGETNAGWLPHTLNYVDQFYLRWYTYFDAQLPKLPSEYFRDNFLFNFIDDRLAMQFRHYIGVRNLTWGSDFPHSVGTHPHSREKLEDLFEGVPDAERDMVLVGNLCDHYGLDRNSQITATP